MEADRRNNPEISSPSGSPVRSFSFEVDVTEAAGFGASAHVALELIAPESTAPELIFVCIPGGGMNRRYFDLPTPTGEEEVSFARAMAAKGYAVALIDPLGVGGSSAPADGYELHPDNMAAANTRVVRWLLEGLRAGSLTDACPAAPSIRSIGVGHSFGALLMIVQQAADPMHDAVAVLGFHTAGLPAQLTDADVGIDPIDARPRLVELSRARFPMDSILLTPPPSKRPVSAAAALDRVYMTPSYMAMLPGMVAEDAAAIETPILIVLGDGDLHGDPHRTPAAYAGSRDITLLVLKDTRHNHFIFPSRTYLFERIARWAASL